MTLCPCREGHFLRFGVKTGGNTSSWKNAHHAAVVSGHSSTVASACITHALNDTHVLWANPHGFFKASSADRSSTCAASAVNWSKTHACQDQETSKAVLDGDWSCVTLHTFGFDAHCSVTLHVPVVCIVQFVDQNRCLTHPDNEDSGEWSGLMLQGLVYRDWYKFGRQSRYPHCQVLQ